MLLFFPHITKGQSMLRHVYIPESLTRVWWESSRRKAIALICVVVAFKVCQQQFWSQMPMQQALTLNDH